MASEITLNPPNGLWTSTNTVNDVYPDLFKNPMEYYWFSQNFSDVLPVLIINFIILANEIPFI
jgi:hypothetical protein